MCFQLRKAEGKKEYVEPGQRDFQLKKEFICLKSYLWVGCKHETFNIYYFLKQIMNTDLQYLNKYFTLRQK